jgi:ribosomal protein S27AE
MSNSQNEDIEHEPHSSADFGDMDYTDDRGIRVFDRNWTCPNCGDDGELMFRPNSKNTCTRCFWVINGRYNNHVLRDWPLLYRHAQQLLAELGDDWYGTPGDVANRLHDHFDRPEMAEAAWRNSEAAGDLATDGGSEFTTLGDFQ